MIGQKGSLLSLEIVAVALAAIRANALRSVLTTLGIIIGVAAVITMVSMGEGAQQQIQAQIEGMGTNILSISPARSHGMGGVRGGSARLYYDDAVALRDNSGGLLKVAPESSNRQQVTYLRWNDNLEVLGRGRKGRQQQDPTHEYDCAFHGPPPRSGTWPGRGTSSSPAPGPGGCSSARGRRFRQRSWSPT